MEKVLDLDVQVKGNNNTNDSAADSSWKDRRTVEL